MEHAYDIKEGNPNYGNRMRLFCRTGYHLTIFCDSKVSGIQDNAGNLAEFEILEISSDDCVDEVRIRGVHSDLYLSMDEEGNLYGEKDKERATVFIASTIGEYNTYLSKNHQEKNWYVGIKKNGEPKPGARTASDQKAVQFLPFRVE